MRAPAGGHCRRAARRGSRRRGGRAPARGVGERQRLRPFNRLRQPEIPVLRLRAAAAVWRNQGPDCPDAGQSVRSAGARRRRSGRSRRPLQRRMRQRTTAQGTGQHLRSPVRRRSKASDPAAQSRRTPSAGPAATNDREIDRERKEGSACLGRILCGLRTHLRRQLLPGLLFRCRQPGRQPRGGLPLPLPERRHAALFVPVRRHDRAGGVVDRRALRRHSQRAQVPAVVRTRAAPAAAEARAGRRRSPRRRPSTATNRTTSW